MGVNLTKDVQPEQFIKLLSSRPVILQAYPELGSLISSMNEILDGYHTLENTVADTEKAIEKQEDLIDTAQSAVNKATSVYTKLNASPAAFTGTGTGTVVITPTATNVTLQSAITEANTILDNYKKELKTLKSKLADLKKQLSDDYDSMIAKVKEYVSSIINTRVS